MAGPVGWGVLSTARINDAFLGGVADSSEAEAEVVAVASRDATRARDYADEREIATAHGSYESLLADPAVEAVYISLPNSLHLPWARRALDAGKHVLCEKPLGRVAADVAAAFDLADERGLLLAEAFMYRHNPQTVELARLVGDGAIGRLRAVRATFSFPLADEGDVRLSAELAGGSLMDLGCYCVSVARLLAGEPEAAAGVAAWGGEGVDVSFAGSLLFAGGVTAAIDCSFRSAPASSVEVRGDTGVLRVADPWHIRVPELELESDGDTRVVPVAKANSYRLEAEDLSRAIRGTATPRLGRADAVGQARALELLYTAAERMSPPGSADIGT